MESNVASVTIGGKVYGNIGTNGGNLPQDAHLTGTVNNASFVSLPPLKTPVMPLSLFPGTLSVSVTKPAGTSLLPTYYTYTGITGNLHITNPTGVLGMATVVYVQGDLTGGIEVDSGVTAKVYVSGSIITNASQIKNDGQLASNLQIYGVPAAGSSPVIQINGDASLVAAIYAPAHQVYLNGNNDVSGAIVAGSFRASGAVRVHYDEALAMSIGPMLRYEISSWQEITN